MIATFSISQQGESHVISNTVCQDYSASRIVRLQRKKKLLSISAVADGVGSCQYSHYGSKTAVEEALQNIEEHLEATYPQGTDAMIALIRSSFALALQKIEECADLMEMPFPLFDTTLTIAVFDGKRVWYGHIGDSGIVALFKNGTYSLITHRHKGEEANSVFPLPNRSLWEFGTIEEVVSFVLMTDGVLDFCVGNEKLANRIYFPFLKPALTEPLSSQKKVDFAKKDWNAFFAGKDNPDQNFRTVVTDDISFVVVQNVQAVKRLPSIGFDYEAWDKKTREYLAEQDRILNQDYEEWKKRKEESSNPDPLNNETSPSEHAPNGPKQIENNRGKDHIRWAKELKSLLGIKRHPSTVVDTKSGYCTGLFFGGKYEIGELISTTSDGWFYEVTDGRKKMLMKQLKNPMAFVKNALLGESEDAGGPSSAEILDLVFNFGNGVFGFLYPRE